MPMAAERGGRQERAAATGRRRARAARAGRLESGIAPAEVARRAGHSIAVLFRFYAKAIHRNQQRSNEQIERSLDAAEKDEAANDADS